MPPKKGTAAKLANLNQANATPKDSCNDANLQENLDRVSGLLSDAHAQIIKLEAALSAEQHKNAYLAETLAHAQEKIVILTGNLAASQATVQKWYHQLRIERQARKRADTHKLTLGKKIAILEEAQTKSVESRKQLSANASHAIESLIHMEKHNSVLQAELFSCMERSKLELEVAKKDFSVVRRKLGRVQVCFSRAQQKYAKDSGPMQATVKSMTKALKAKSTFSLLEKGVYTPETCNLIHLLVKCGCAKEYVDQVIHGVLKCAGVKALGHVSRCTVSRVLVEGYIASQIQLGYEMTQTDGVCCITFLSSD